MEPLEPSKRLDLTPAGLVRAEAALLQLPQIEMPVKHYFAPGVCVRELFMPAGTLVLGHAHRFADLNILLQGRLTLLNADGTLTEVCGPLTFLGAPGRKIAYVHEDATWQNVFPLQTATGGELPADVEAVEAYYVDKSPGWEADQAQRRAIATLARESDREDFAAWLAYHALPADDVRRISENLADQVPMPAGELKFQVGPSAIEGSGLIATATIAAGEVIGPARIAGKRTPCGRFTNHAAVPNAEIVVGTGNWDLVLVATRTIAGCQGGQPGEEITVNYEQVLQANRVLAAELAKKYSKTKEHLCQSQQPE